MLTICELKASNIVTATTKTNTLLLCCDIKNFHTHKTMNTNSWIIRIPPSIFHHIYFNIFVFSLFGLRVFFSHTIFVHVRGIQSKSIVVFFSLIFGKLAHIRWMPIYFEIYLLNRRNVREKIYDTLTIY